MFWKWGQSCNLDIFPFDRAMHLLKNIIGRFELTSWGVTNVWGGSSKIHVHDSRQIRAKVPFLDFAPKQAVPFQRGGSFESPCQILRCITDVWSPSLSERHSQWGKISWTHECERRIILKTFCGTNAVNFSGVDTFQQLHTSSVPWGERQHRGEVDRHCLALFCWRKAHCCFQIRMIGHFFRNYIWIHSLHALQGCWLFRHRVCQKK